MATFSNTVPCGCGCGLPAPLANHKTKRVGIPYGQPLRFRAGHHNTFKAKSWPDRFWARVDKTGKGLSFGGTPCWLWTGGTTPNGAYGTHHRRQQKKIVTVVAHRAAYELLVDEIPDGYTVDHKCRNTLCVNPAHLEPVPHIVNLLRGHTVNAVNAAKTHCKHGHAFTAENTYIRPDNGNRMCKTCNRLASRRSVERKRARS